MSEQPSAPDSDDPLKPALTPDNVWSSHRLRRRQKAARRQDAEAGADFAAAPARRFSWLSVAAGGAGLVLVAALLTALAVQFLTKPKKPPGVSITPEAAAEQWQGATPSEVRDGFLAAKSHSDRMQWVRSPAVVEPLVSAFYSTGPGSREKVTDFLSVPLPSFDSALPALEIARYGVLTEDGGRRLISIVRTTDGAKLDFHTYSRHTSAPWPDILTGRASKAEVRIFVSPGRYHAAPFESSADWLPVVGGSPDVGADLLLYVRRGTPECAAIEAALPAAPQRVTISIAPAQESWKQRQFQITDFHAMEWLGRQD
jgi:hypothetical protein